MLLLLLIDASLGLGKNQPTDWVHGNKLTSFISLLFHATGPQFIKILLITILSGNIYCITVIALFYVFKYTILMFSNLQAVSISGSQVN